jgi:hypothetical protein
MPLLLNETAALEFFGYFVLAVLGVVVLFMLLLGKIAFGTNKKTTAGKASRTIYLLLVGFLALVLLAFTVG